METGGHGYSLERLAHLHGIVETVLFELGRALKSLVESLPPCLSLLSGGRFSTYTLPEVSCLCFTRTECFLWQTEVVCRNPCLISQFGVSLLLQKNAAFFV